MGAAGNNPRIDVVADSGSASGVEWQKPMPWKYKLLYKQPLNSTNTTTIIMSESTFTFMNREYNTKDFIKEVTGLAEELAKNARIVDPLLPLNVDLSGAEEKKVADQVSAPGYPYRT